MFLRTSIIFGRKRIRSSSHRILDIYQSVDPNGRINISLSILCPTQSEIRKFHSSKFKNNVDTTVDAHTAPFLPPSSSSSLSPSITNQFVVPVRIGPSLKKYGQNLTQAASDGKLDPVIGRDKEIERTLQVLSRRTKNNPCLIGKSFRNQYYFSEVSFPPSHFSSPSLLTSLYLCSS